MRYTIQVEASWASTQGDLTAMSAFRAFPRLAGPERSARYDGRSFVTAVYEVNCADLADARREAIRLFHLESGLIGGFSPKPSRVQADQFEPRRSRPAITGRAGGSEAVRAVSVLGGDPPTVVLVVSDRHHDAIAVATHETPGVPSRRFAGHWSSGYEQGDGTGPLSFVLEAPLRRWYVVRFGEEVVAAASRRHWVALVPAGARSLKAAVPERRAILASALVVEIGEQAALVASARDPWQESERS